MARFAPACRTFYIVFIGGYFAFDAQSAMATSRFHYQVGE